MGLIETETAKFRVIEAELAVIAATVGADQPTISLDWSNRFTARMGDARVTDHLARTGQVRLSAYLWPEATEWKRRNTMIHEIAHIYADLTLPGAKHGWVWKQWMHRFGEPAERYYSVNSQSFQNPTKVQALSRRRRQTRYVLPCPMCRRDLIVKEGLRKRWIRNNEFRRCMACKASLGPHLAEAAEPEVK